MIEMRRRLSPRRMGAAAITAAKVSSVRRVIAADRIPGRLELAQELGASGTIDTNSLDLEEAPGAQGGRRLRVLEIVNFASGVH